jgi:hypothetical protein
MNDLTPDSVAVRLYAAMHRQDDIDVAVNWLNSDYHNARVQRATWNAVAAEHERLCSDRIAAAEKAARVKALEELREILQPFAAEADMWGDSVPDDYAPLCVEMGHTDGRYYGSPAKYTLAHLRKIRALITAAEAQPEGKNAHE